MLTGCRPSPGDDLRSDGDSREPDGWWREQFSVVLADDTPEIRLLVRRILERQGSVTVVGEATNGAEAVDLVQVHRPHAIVLDLAMPVMDGFEALPRIKAACPTTKIVALSGFSASEVGKEALRLGADAYLEKGVVPKRIVETVLGIIGAEGSDDPPLSPATTRAEPPESNGVFSGGLELLSVLTHELRNALIIVEGFTSMIACELEGSPVGAQLPVVHEALGGITRGGQHMRRLLDTLVDVRRLEANELVLESEDLDLPELVSTAVADLMPLTTPHPVHVRSLLPSLLVRADSTRLRQVLMNLLSNAAKFSDPDAAIEIEMARHDDFVHVSVIDHGPGIAAGDRAKLFCKFCRLRQDIKGMGLGLYVSRQIMRAHGGDLTCEPADQGGCCFVLALPVPSRVES